MKYKFKGIHGSSYYGEAALTVGQIYESYIDPSDNEEDIRIIDDAGVMLFERAKYFEAVE